MVKISHVSNINMGTSVIPKKEFPKLFEEMGEFKGEVNIRIKPNVKPFAQTVPT